MSGVRFATRLTGRMLVVLLFILLAIIPLCAQAQPASCGGHDGGDGGIDLIDRMVVACGEGGQAIG